MMKERFFLSLALPWLFCLGVPMRIARKSGKKTLDFVANSFDVASQHLSNAIDQYQDITKFPRSTNPDGSLHTRAANNWVSGFFPGSLWYMYEYSE
jgi:unsaturated chondroitin disaccharide hydrolase